MKINISVKRKFKINGKEYDSIDEMPDSIRETFKKAMGSQTGSGHQMKQTATQTKIIFNGTEYGSINAMPHDVRQSYEKILKSAEEGTAPPEIDIAGISSGRLKGEQFPGIALAGDKRKPLKAEPSFSVRAFIVGIMLFALMLLFYYLFRGR